MCFNIYLLQDDQSFRIMEFKLIINNKQNVYKHSFIWNYIII